MPNWSVRKANQRVIISHLSIITLITTSVTRSWDWNLAPAKRIYDDASKTGIKGITEFSICRELIGSNEALVG
jgi:hypothetical protein